jgi:hypothetical protein
MATKHHPRREVGAEIIAAPVKRGAYGDMSVASAVVVGFNVTTEDSVVLAVIVAGFGGLTAASVVSALVSSVLTAADHECAVSVDCSVEWTWEAVIVVVCAV